MRLMKGMGMAVALGLAGLPLPARETNEVEVLRQQLQQATEAFENAVREHRRVVEELNRRLQTLQPPAARTNALPAPAPVALPDTAPEPEAPPTAEATADRSWRPSDPIRFGGAQAYMDVGLVGTFAVGGSTASDIEGGTQSGGHDPYQRGFNVQGLELNLQGAVDPYFRANANFVYSLNGEGESFFEVEEGWLETAALPGNLKVRGGQIYTEFGRHNPTHLHTWSFVDTPLVNGRFLGADGLRNPGATFSWLTPTPFYSELMVSLQNSHGATAAGFRSSGHTHGHDEADGPPLAYRHADNDRGFSRLTDLLFAPRYVMSFDLTRNQVLLLGGSAAFGPNARGGEGGGDTTTQIYGVDLTWKWKSPRHHGGFPFVQWQSEAILRKYDAGAFDWDENGNGALDDGEIGDWTTGLPAVLPREMLTDYGFYTQWTYGFRKGWVAGLRLDYLTSEPGDYERRPLTLDGGLLGRDAQRAERWRLSPDLTWYPSEYSKLRLQYNYDDRRFMGNDHSVWLQLEFVLGAHAAHTF